MYEFTFRPLQFKKVLYNVLTTNYAGLLCANKHSVLHLICLCKQHSLGRGFAG